MQRLNAATPKILSLIPIEQLLGASRVNGGGDASLCQRAMAGLRLGGGLAVDDWGNGRETDTVQQLHVQLLHRISLPTVDAEVMAAVNEGGSGGSQRGVVAVWRTRF